MNAINLALIPTAAPPQQAAPATAQSALPDGLQFALWLGQYGAASANPDAPPSGKQAVPADATPAELTQLLQQIAVQPVALAVNTTEAKLGLKLDAMLQALLETVLEALHNVLDAGSQSQATAQLGPDQTPPAGDTATDTAATKSAPEADEPGSTKQAAVMWLQSAPSADKQTAVMWLQDELAPAKQAAVMWLQGGAPPVKQATKTPLPTAAEHPIASSLARTAIASDQLDSDPSQLLIELWPKLAAELQALLQSRYGLTVQVGQLAPQPLTSNQAPMPWALHSLAINGSGQLPVELLADQNAGSVPLPVPAAGDAIAVFNDWTPPALPVDLSLAPASIRWFALGGLDSQTAPSRASTMQAYPAVETSAPAIAGDVVLSSGDPIKAVIIADSQPGVQGLQPTAMGQAQDAVNGSTFTVSLINPGEELGLLTAKLTVRRIAELGNQLPLQQPLWASQPPAPLEPEVSQVLWQPAPAQPATADNLPVSRLTVEQATTTIQPTPNVNPAMAKQPEVAVPAITLAQQAEAIASQQHIIQAASVSPEQLAPASVAIAPAQVRQAAQIHAALKAEPTQRAAKAQRLAQAEPPSLPTPAPQPAALHPQIGEFTLRPVSNVVGKAPRWDAAPDANTVTPGVAFNALPAQLMQFSGREFEIKPYAGLQFSELTAKLLEQAATARSQGDGTYQATLDLNPPSLGRMSVSIAVHGDSVAMQLAVASGVPREQLKGNLAALQRSLEEAGLHVVELKVVTVDPDGQPAKQYHEQPDQAQPTDLFEDDASRLAFSQELGSNYA